MKTFIIYTLLFLNLISCSKENKPKAKDPLWGKEACAHCRMIVSEKNFAVQKVFDSGHRFYYDDFYCAFKHKIPSDFADKNSEFYVRPDGMEVWITAESARYKKGLRSPMGGGVGAVSDAGELDFNQVKEIFKNQ